MIRVRSNQSSAKEEFVVAPCFVKKFSSSDHIASI